MLLKMEILVFSLSLLWLNATSSNEKGKKCLNIDFYRKFICFNVASLEVLDKAQRNVTNIRIAESKLYSIPGYAFARFGTTLTSLDLHDNHLNTIESNGLTGLMALETLILWGNELTWVSADWFGGISQNLKHLDLSFNRITGIDVNFFYNVYNLQSLYLDNNKIITIDYSLFSLLPYLKNVQIGNNPWQWDFRIALLWQLENQRVTTNEIWDNWDWMSYATQKCRDEGHDLQRGDDMLNCVFNDLHNILNTNTDNSTVNKFKSLSNYGEIVSKGSQLSECFKNSVVKENSEVTMIKLYALFRKLLLLDAAEEFHVLS